MQRFYRQIEIDATTDCWNWIGPVYNSGYGKFSFATTDISAHRFSYELHVGDLERGKVVRHTCDNKLCVNPEHLVMGTHRENTQDMFERRRAPNAQLDPDKVRIIRSMRRESQDTLQAIADKFGVTLRTIEAVMSGQNWGWVK